jgi:hypothetical protein
MQAGWHHSTINQNLPSEVEIAKGSLHVASMNAFSRWWWASTLGSNA